MTLLQKMKLITAALGLLALSACTTTGQIQLGQLDNQSKMVFNGKIITIEKVEYGANLPGRIAGAMLGSSLGKQKGFNGAGRVVSSMVGIKLADSYYGGNADKVVILSEDGNQYQAVVPTEYFKIHEKVRFTLKDSDVKSIASHVVAGI